jgi:hypothetical protein
MGPKKKKKKKKTKGLEENQGDVNISTNIEYGSKDLRTFDTIGTRLNSHSVGPAIREAPKPPSKKKRVSYRSQSPITQPPWNYGCYSKKSNSDSQSSLFSSKSRGSPLKSLKKVPSYKK